MADGVPGGSVSLDVGSGQYAPDVDYYDDDSVSTAESPGAAAVPPLVYWLGRSAVDEAAIRGYVRRNFFKNAADARPPGEEESPDPRPYEAVVFRDFFEAGFVFPCSPFVRDKDGFVFEVEKIARHICGNYGTKEEDAKVRCLGEGARRLNRAFLLGGMVYAERVLPEKAVPLNGSENATGTGRLLKRPVVIKVSSKKKNGAVARHAATVKRLEAEKKRQAKSSWRCDFLNDDTAGGDSESEMAGGKRAALDASRRTPSSGAAISAVAHPPQVQAVQRTDSRLKRTADASIRVTEVPTSSTAPAGRLLKKPDVTSTRMPAGAAGGADDVAPVLLPEDITGCVFGRGAVPPPPPADAREYGGGVRVYSSAESMGAGTGRPDDPGRARAVAIANALGMPPKAQLVGGCDFRAMGIVPDDESRSAFGECASSFGMPEAERDITFEDDLQLEEAVISHGVSTILLGRAMQRRRRAFQTKTARVADKEGAVVADLRRQLAAKESEVAELKRDLAGAREACQGLREAAREKDATRKLELSKIRDAVRAVYHEFRHGLSFVGMAGDGVVDEESDDVNVFLKWVSDEAADLRETLAVTGELGASVGVRTLWQALLSQGCKHLRALGPCEVSEYQTVSEEALVSAGRFVEDFWRKGGDELAARLIATNMAEGDEAKATAAAAVTSLFANFR